MNLLQRFAIAVLVCLVAGAVTPVLANIVVFEPAQANYEASLNAYDSWLAAVGPTVRITWDDVPANDGTYTTIGGSRYSYLPNSPTLAVDDRSGLFVGNPNNDSKLSNDVTFFGQDFYPFSQNNVFSPDASGSPEGILTITFAEPVHALGVWFLDVEGDSATTGIQPGSGTLYHFSRDQGDNSRSFLGIVSDQAFTTFNIHMASGPAANGVGIDDVIWPVPAPAALLLGSLGLGLVGWVKRRMA